MKKSKKVLLSVFAVMVASALIATFVVTFYGKSYKRAEDTAFSILQVTDPHILNDEKKDAKAYKTITEMIKTTTPDMIIVTGDITSEKENMTAFKNFGSFMEAFNIPWAFTFGNHEGLDIKYENGEVVDGETIADKQQISDYLETLENCIYEAGDDDVDGMGNYYYIVRDKDGKAITALIMMDSNSYDNEHDCYDYFHDNQVEWYEQTIKSIAKSENGASNKVVPSLAFFHIPMREFVTAYDEGKQNGNLISGKRFEKSGCSEVDDEMFETMLKLGSTKGVFVGHDHMNNYSVDYKGIRLTYGLSCDHNIYVVPFRGGKLINIKNDGTFTTQSIIRHRGQQSVTVGKEM